MYCAGKKANKLKISTAYTSRKLEVSDSGLPTS